MIIISIILNIINFLVLISLFVKTFYKNKGNKGCNTSKEDLKKFKIIRFTDFSILTLCDDLHNVLYTKSVIQKIKKDTNINLSEYTTKNAIKTIITPSQLNNCIFLKIYEAIDPYQFGSFSIDSTFGKPPQIFLEMQLTIEYCNEILQYVKKINLLK